MKNILKAIFPSLEYVLVFIGTVISAFIGFGWMMEDGNPLAYLIAGLFIFFVTCTASIRDILNGDDMTWDEWSGSDLDDDDRS